MKGAGYVTISRCLLLALPRPTRPGRTTSTCSKAMNCRLAGRFVRPLERTAWFCVCGGGRKKKEDNCMVVHRNVIMQDY